MNVEVDVVPTPETLLNLYVNAHSLTILDVNWISGRENFWVVSVKTLDWEIKHYIKQISWVREPALDIIDILKTWTKFYPQVFRKFIS